MNPGFFDNLSDEEGAREHLQDFVADDALLGVESTECSFDFLDIRLRHYARTRTSSFLNIAGPFPDDRQRLF